MAAALDERFQVSGGDLLAWRHHQLQQGGEAADFDWLLDLAGGLSWSQLQALRLDPQRPVQRCHEPALALDGGQDGLAALRTIVAGAPQALAPGGLLLLEHHHDQSAAVLALLEHAGLEQPQAHRDLEGHWRFASASKPR